MVSQVIKSNYILYSGTNVLFLVNFFFSASVPKLIFQCIKISLNYILKQNYFFQNDTHPSLLKESMLRENAIKRCYRLRSDKLISESVKYKSKAESFEGEVLLFLALL